MKTMNVLAGLALGAGLSVSASAGSVVGSNFDQIAKINMLGGTVTQIGGAGNGNALSQASDFMGTVGTQTGVGVTLPGWQFLTSANLTDVAPTQAGNIASVLTGTPTDLTFTTPGAGGPDGTNGDGSVSLSTGDFFVASFGSTITAFAGETEDLIIFTNTDGSGRINVEMLLGGQVVESILNVPAASGNAGTGIGGILIDILDGTAFDGIRITSTQGFGEIDAVAARAIPLPGAVGLAGLGMFCVPGVVRRRRTAC